ncbi:MAG: hypothetical protein DRO40_02360 [Thermoprotei archaeon]|nr:MAG: hypothetical protein DRO40_02360 [Thermoprotei archaeon]
MKRARVTDQILRLGDEEMISTDTMKKLSPTDPSINFKFRLTFTLVFVSGTIVSKIIRDLISCNIKNVVYLGEDTLGVTVTFRLGKRNIINSFFNILRQYSNKIRMLCYELRASVPSKRLNKLPLRIIKQAVINNNTASIASINNRYVWVYVNNKKNKVILKFIEAKIISAHTLDPASLPQSLFIVCKDSINIEELINEINEKIKEYLVLAMRKDIMGTEFNH